MVKLVVNSVCAIKMQSGSRIGAGSRSPHSFYSQFSFQEEDEMNGKILEESSRPEGPRKPMKFCNPTRLTANFVINRNFLSVILAKISVKIGLKSGQNRPKSGQKIGPMKVYKIISGHNSEISDSV